MGEGKEICVYSDFCDGRKDIRKSGCDERLNQ